MLALAQDSEDSADLMPAPLALARSGLASHPLAVQSVALVRAAPTYHEQAALTGLGYDTAEGRRLWAVEKVPLCGPDGREWPGAFGVRRSDTGEAIGTVGSRYAPMQNADRCASLEDTFSHLPPSLRPRIENAGALGSGAGVGRGARNVGARVFAQLNLPPEFSALLRVPQDRDSELRAFLTLTGANDGSAREVIGASVIRIVCRNTHAAASKEAKVKGLALRHTSGPIGSYRDTVSTWLREVGAAYRAHGDLLRHYASKPMGSAAVALAASEILDVAPEATNRTKAQSANVDAIVDMIIGRDGQFVARGEVSAYSVLQAVTAYEMHRRPARGELAAQTETRLWSVLAGETVIPRAFAVLDRAIA